MKKNYEDIALGFAETYGITEYKVQGNKMIYISFYHEGNYGGYDFYKKTINLDTLEQIDCKGQKTCKGSYNYYCG